MDATPLLQYIVNFHSHLQHSFVRWEHDKWILMIFYSLRDADTETQHISPRPNLKRSRLDGFETTETEVEPKPKRQMVKQLGFTHVKTVVSLRPSDLPKRTKSANAPSESVKSKPAIESIRRGPSTVAELLEQERAVRAQSRDAPSSPISPTKDKKNSMPSTTSNEHTPTHSERLDRAIVERRRLYIHKMIPWTKKRNVVRTQISL